MPSRRDSEALPVLTLLKDFSRALIALSMLSLSSSKITSFMSSTSDDCSHGLSADDPSDVTRLLQIEDDQGKPVIPAHGYRCCIHNFKVTRQYICKAYLFIHYSIGVLEWIPVINSFHLRRLEDDIRLDFDGTEGCRGVGCKIGISRSRGKNHHQSFLQVADRPPLDERLSDLPHLYGRLHPCADTLSLKGALEGKTVDHGGQHPHVVGGGSIHPLGAGSYPPESVSAPYNDPELHPEGNHLPDFPGNVTHDLIIDA